MRSVRVCTGEPGPWDRAWAPPGWDERSWSARRRAAARAGAACVGTDWNVVAVGRGDGAMGQETSLGCPACWPWPAAAQQAYGVEGSWKWPVLANPSAAASSSAAAVVVAAAAVVAAAVSADAANFAGLPCSLWAGPFEPWVPSDP